MTLGLNLMLQQPPLFWFQAFKQIFGAWLPGFAPIQLQKHSRGLAPVSDPVPLTAE